PFRARRPTQGFCGRLSATTESVHWNLRPPAVLPSPPCRPRWSPPSPAEATSMACPVIRSFFQPISLLFFGLLVMITSATTARADSLGGKVVDAQGLVVPNATIVLHDRNSGDQRNTVSARDGSYRF